MGSSEIVESGRLAGQKSTFAHTCSLLSQYLKEKGSLGDLSLGLSRGFDSHNGAPAKTMDLLPMIEKNNQNQEASSVSVWKSPTMPVNLFPHQAGFGPAFAKPKEEAHMSVVKSEPETAPMTIFYGGQVIVFNDFPADKANEVILLAKGIGSPRAVNTLTTNMVPKPAEPAVASLGSPSTSIARPSFVRSLVPETAQRPLQPNVTDLPIARKASLTRFLEKRKDRITAKAPYPVGVSSSSSKSAESKAWMGLPAQMERQSFHLGS